MAFHFPFEAVLRVRRGQERVERLKLEAIASEQARAKGQLDQMTEQFFESRRRFQRQMGQGTSGSELQFENARSELVAAARRALQVHILELEQQRLNQVRAYIKARQRREILENLRARQLEIFRQSLSRREQQQLDDLFLMRQSHPREE
jgi:flagellar export protein FliJ